MERSLGKLAEKGGRTAAEVLPRVTAAVDDSCEADLLIEAVVEDLGVKQDVFRAADDELPARRDPRVEHELDPDRLARRVRPRGPSE